MKRILVTGVTGAIGSHLAPRLAAGGWDVVCVVRGKDGRGGGERLAEEFGPLAARMTAVGDDIRRPMLGLTPEQVAGLKGTVAATLHCAASVSFDEDEAAETWETNLGGTRNFLDLSQALGVREAHLVSTAYVAGDAPEFAETDFDRGQRARNPYEASKLAAEGLLRERFPGAFTIYRPSIVVGDSASGYTRAFDGYYGFVKTWHRLAQFLTGRASLPAGITRQGDRLHLPLSLRSRPGATMNMIPVDWVTDAIVRLLELPATGRCYHLTHPHPVDMATVAEVSSRYLGLEGVRIDPEPLEGLPPAAQGLQRRLDAHLERYRCYINGEAVFGHAAVREALGPGYAPPPPIDQQMLFKLLDYAVSVDWQPRPSPRAAGA
jgi:nucleoside-diphosphate-sugar epimerase